MGDTKSSASINFSGIGSALLTALFVWLKVEGKIDWSWWWVFSPIWIPMCFGLVIMGLIAAIVFWVKGD